MNSLAPTQFRQNNMGGGGGNGSLPTPDRKRFVLWEATAGAGPFAAVQPINPWTLTNDIFVSFDGGASQTDFPATANRNQAIGFNCGTFQSREYLGEIVFWPGRNNRFLTRSEFNYDNAATDGKLYFGLGDSQFINSGPDPTPTGNFIGFFANKIGGSALPVFYACQIWVGGVLEFTVATTFQVLAGVAYDFEITTSNGIVTFFINGVPVAANPKTILLPAVPVGVYMGMKSRSGIPTDIRFLPEYFYNETQNIA